MKTLALLLLLTSTLTASPGDAYRASCTAALQPVKCGDVKRGSREWQQQHDDWCDGKSDKKPSDDYDGHGYSDSKDSAREADKIKD